APGAARARSYERAGVPDWRTARATRPGFEEVAVAAPALGAGQQPAERPRRVTGRRAEPEPSRGLDEAEVERLLAALTAVRDGDFRVRLRVPGDADSPMARLATVANEVVDRNRQLTGELDRVRRVVGRDGRLDERLRPGNAEGAWAAA